MGDYQLISLDALYMNMIVVYLYDYIVHILY